MTKEEMLERIKANLTKQGFGGDRRLMALAEAMLEAMGGPDDEEEDFEEEPTPAPATEPLPEPGPFAASENLSQ